MGRAAALLYNRAMDLAGKGALVTGGGSGIGRATALALAEAGSAVAVTDIDEIAGRETVQLIESGGGRSIFVRTDVTQWSDLERAVASASDTFGGLHILHNNAGINTGWPDFPDSPRERWERVVAINFWAMIAAIQLVTPVMRESGGGAVINMASLAGLTPYGTDPIYAATKHGIVGLTRSLARLKEEADIRVNCLCPGFVDTPLPRRRLGDMPPEQRARWESAIESMPMIAPSEIAEAALELARDESLAGEAMLVLAGGTRKLVPVPGIS
jgi:NAD(P)-dependent dehydrogenase (short-subunit alcohol dehydrogenase family)